MNKYYQVLGQDTCHRKNAIKQEGEHTVPSE